MIWLELNLNDKISNGAIYSVASMLGAILVSVSLIGSLSISRLLFSHVLISPGYLLGNMVFTAQ